MDSADVILTKNDLNNIKIDRNKQKTIRNIKQNLFGHSSIIF